MAVDLAKRGISQPQRSTAAREARLAPNKPSGPSPAPATGPSNYLQYWSTVNGTGYYEAEAFDMSGNRIERFSFDVDPSHKWFVIFEKPQAKHFALELRRAGFLRERRTIKVNAPDTSPWKLEAGDVDKNDIINQDDLALVAYYARPALDEADKHFRELKLPNRAQDVWEQDCDLNGDGKLDGVDVRLVLSNLGRKAKVE